MMAQRELNRHAAVVIKIFKKGKNWGPGTRVRETRVHKMLGSRDPDPEEGFSLVRKVGA